MTEDFTFGLSPARPPISIDDYLARFTMPELIDDIVRLEGLDRDAVAEMLPRYAAEARFGWHRVAPHLPREGRILEVGSGLGFLSGYLRETGYNVTPLEPYATGFDVFSKVLNVLTEQALVPPPLNITAEELTPARHGTFDFIFSVNVLEHIHDLDRAFASMVSVLGQTGRMWHNCPNYAAPYEPHFSVPLVPFFPAATRFLLPKRITGTGLWKSINFITVRRLRKLARLNGCEMALRPGLLAEALKRLDSDASFAARHRGWVTRLYGIFKATGFLKLLELCPASLATPIEVEIWRRK